MSHKTERDAHDERVFAYFKNGGTLEDSLTAYENEIAEAQKEFAAWVRAPKAEVEEEEEKEWDGQGCNPEGCHHLNLVGLMFDQASRPECPQETGHVLLVAAFETASHCDEYENLRPTIAEKCLELCEYGVDPNLDLCHYYLLATGNHLPNCDCFEEEEPICVRKTVDQLTEDEKEFLALFSCSKQAESEYDRLFNLTKDLKPPYSRSDRALMREFEKEKQAYYNQ